MDFLQKSFSQDFSFCREINSSKPETKKSCKSISKIDDDANDDLHLATCEIEAFCLCQYPF
jgi:hypothetical protein